MKMLKTYTTTPSDICVIGIDPGYGRLGIAVIKKEKNKQEVLIYSCCVETCPKKEHSERLFYISNAVDDCIKKHKPDLLAVESIFFNTNKKTVLKVAEARGVIISRAAFFGVEVHEFSPLQVKLAITGYGRSSKNQIINTLPRIIKIEKEIKHDDEYDAIAVGLTCLTVSMSPLYMKKNT